MTANWPFEDVLARFVLQATHHPTAPAIAWRDTGVTYGDLLDRCERLSAQLRQSGVAADTVVGVRMERSDELVVAMLAVLHAGAAYLPLDLSVPLERAAYMLDSSCASVLLTDPGRAADLQTGATTVLEVATRIGGRHAPVQTAATASPEQLAYVLYTSGSTGKPKGVQISRAAFHNAIASFERILDANARDVFLSVTGTSFDIFELEVMLPLTTGGLIVMAERDRLLETGYLAGLASQHGATLFQTTPTLARNLLDSGWQPDPALRILIGGEALTPELAQRLKHAHAVFNVYGPTEATIWVSADRVVCDGVRPPVIGTALPNTCLHVLDCNLDLMPVGGPGELFIGGPQLARGYAGRPDLTADRFIPSPFDVGQRLYRTGDLVCRNEDGSLDYLGRADQQVKLRGHRIELGEIEAVIGTHSGVASAITIVREDTPGNPLLVAYYTAAWNWLDQRADVELANAQTAAWADIYDERYAQEGEAAGNGDHSVWIDSRTGDPYTPAQMQEWIDTTVARVAQFGARRILEIGCGSGQLLLRLADRTERYLGTDASAQALQALRRKTEHLPQVELMHLSADRTFELCGGQFDLVVINSVAQYFPSAAYLADVLKQARRLLAPEGTIFVGDVRNRSLLDAFYAAVETGRNHKGLTAAQLTERIARRAKRENELCLDPTFFATLKDRLSLRSVQLLSRRGRAETEMNAFRFDAVLDAHASGYTPATICWHADVWNAVHLEKLLETFEGPALRIAGLPDMRTSVALALLQGNERNGSSGGFHPEDLIRIAERFGLFATAGAPDARGTFDLLVTSDAASLREFEITPLGVPAAAPAESATRPLQREMLRELEEELRLAAVRQLPEYMVPSAFVHLDRFPLNASGKLDRHALPQPHIELEGAVQLKDEAQAAIASVMAEVLGLAYQPGPQCDFFKLGGHSLAAVRLAARLRERFGSAFDLHTVFELRTVEALAAQVRQTDGGLAFASLARREYPAGERVVPSRAQSSLWFLDRLDGVSAIYNMPMAVRIEGNLDVNALRAAIARVIERHVVLRTIYLEVDGSPVGVVNDAGSCDLPVREITGKLETALVDRARLSFDLSRDRLLRAHLFRVDARTHVLLLVVHHIAADGLSMMVLAREIGEFYALESGCGKTAEPAAAGQYADFAQWQQDALAEPELESRLAWWRWHLQDAPQALELPTDRPRALVAEHRGACVRIDIPAALRAEIESFARTHDASAYGVLLSAFAILLGRLANQREVVVGVPAGGRQLSQFEQSVGLFANVLPLRLLAIAETSAADTVRATSVALKEALARQDISFDQIVEHLGVARALNRMPLVQAVFTYLDAEEDLALPGLRTEPLPIHLGTARFDFALQLSSSKGGGWWGMMEFDSDLFDASTVERWAGHFMRLLRWMARDGATAVADLPLAHATRSSLACTAGPDEDFVAIFERQCAMQPDALALVCGDERLTFAQLAARADRFAGALKRAGVRTGDVIGLHLERTADLAAAIWGTLKLGAAFLPLDTTLPEDRLRYMLAQSRARCVISESIDDATRGQSGWFHPRELLAAGHHRTDLAIAVPPQALAYVIFTSGSTGQPKGVELSRAAFGAYLHGWNETLGIDHRDICMSVASIAFDIFVIELLPMHCAGAAVVMADRRKLLELSYAIKLMEDENVTFMTATPSLLSAWSGCGWVPRPGLRIVTGGEAIAPELAERLSVQCELWNGYGPTEATCAQTVGRLQSPFGVRCSIGTAFGRNEMFVLDQRLNPVPVGVVGELYIAGAQLARGYSGRADLTAGRFIPSPFHVGERLYRTGDLVRWRADGQLEHCGRSDDQVKIRGYRIELGEIEGRLLACAGIAAAAVVARDDPAGNKRLIAYVVPAAGRAVDVQSLEAQVAHQLPPYMMPSRFVALAALPMTRNGKLDKNALPAPDWGCLATGSETATSLSSLEGQVAALMAQVLGSDRAVAIDTNFFAAGGHSLAAVRLAAQVQREFGVEISLRTFFDDPTPAGIARHVRATGNARMERSPFVSFGHCAGPAVFLVHGADGYAINFRHLGEELSPHVHLWGIDCAHSWLPDGAADGLGVPELARLYAERLLRDFPQLGEFHIGGWSFGGLVALELAGYLRSRGCKVASAFAIDSAMNGGAEDVLGAVGNKVGIQALASRNLLEAGHTQAEVKELFDPGSLPSAIGELYEAFESHVAAAARFDPQPHDGDFTLIMAREGLVTDKSSQARWREVIRGEFTLREIKGGHLSILRQPAVTALAREIADCVLASSLVEQ